MPWESLDPMLLVLVLGGLSVGLLSSHAPAPTDPGPGIRKMEENAARAIRSARRAAAMRQRLRRGADR